MNFLELLGLSVLIYAFYQLFINALKAFYPLKNFSQRYGPNSWAVITGGSDGIGKGFAFVLAKHGFSICIIARNPQKLAKVKEEIEKRYPDTQVKWIKANFEEAFKPNFYEEIYKELEGLDISILINNVGVAITNYFEQIPEDIIQKNLIVNIMPQVLLTRKLITKLLDRKGHKSAIINLSSVLGTHPIPYNTIYSSCKVFNDFFSRALNQEYRKKIDILSLRPFYVSTPATYDKKPCIDTITAEECAEGCLRALGKWDFTWGHYKHAIQGFGYSFMPGWFVTLMAIIFGPYRVRYRTAQDKKYIRG